MIHCLNLIGLGLSFLGTLLLAVSLNQVIDELVRCLLLVDTTLGALVGDGDVPRFDGLRQRLDRGIKSAKLRTLAGIVMVAGGFLSLLAADFFPRFIS